MIITNNESSTAAAAAEAMNMAGSRNFLWISDDGLRARHLDDTGNEMLGEQLVLVNWVLSAAVI